MKRKQVLIIILGALGSLLTVLVAILINFATSTIPLIIQPYLSFAWPLVGVVALVTMFVAIALARLQLTDENAVSARQGKNRQRMLEKVCAYWITGVLKRSLHSREPIELELHEKPDLVTHPLTQVVGDVQHPIRTFSSTTPITQVFDEAGGELLILGEPGSGKTTLLLELARQLLQRARGDENYPIPVVFNLSSWVVKRQPIADWLIDELHNKYQIPRKLGQFWIDASELLLLLDGLDEVVSDHRKACVESINFYRREHGLVPTVVCCRSAEYVALEPMRFLLQNAVILQPLTVQQIDTYLLHLGERCKALRETLLESTTLQKLATAPLMLSVLIQAYSEMSVNNLRATSSQVAPKMISLRLIIQQRDQVEEALGEAQRKDAALKGHAVNPKNTEFLSMLAQAHSERIRELIQSISESEEESKLIQSISKMSVNFLTSASSQTTPQMDLLLLGVKRQLILDELVAGEEQIRKQWEELKGFITKLHDEEQTDIERLEALESLWNHLQEEAVLIQEDPKKLISDLTTAPIQLVYGMQIALAEQVQQRIQQKLEATVEQFWQQHEELKASIKQLEKQQKLSEGDLDQLIADIEQLQEPDIHHKNRFLYRDEGEKLKGHIERLARKLPVRSVKGLTTAIERVLDLILSINMCRDEIKQAEDRIKSFKEKVNETTTRQQVFKAYVQRMLQRRSNTKAYPPEQTTRWLTWLARKMKEHEITEFSPKQVEYLEWLPNPQAVAWYYQYSLREPFWISFGLAWLVYLLLSPVLGFLLALAVASLPMIIHSSLLNWTGNSRWRTRIDRRSVHRALMSTGYIPPNYPRFLDYAAERILLYKVGDSYIFIHHLLLEYFAALELDIALTEGERSNKTAHECIFPFL